MARTLITKQTVDADGLTVVFGPVDATAAPDGNYFNTDGSETVLVTNSGVGPHTMTVDVPVTVDGVEVDDRVVTIPAGETVAWRPKNAHRQSDGQVHLNFGDAVDLTVAILD